MTYVLRYGSIRDGRIYGVIPADAANGSAGMLGAGQVNITVSAKPRDANGDLPTEAVYRSMPPGKGMWALEWRDGPARRIVDAGTTWQRPVSPMSMTMTGAGMFAMLGRRLLAPNVAASLVAAGAVTFTNLDHGSIMRGIVAQVMSMPDGDLPITLQASRSGTRQRTYQGYDMAMAGQRITELTADDPNTEFLLQPRFVTGSTSSVVWDLLTGTEANPQLTNVVPWKLNATAPGQTRVGQISTIHDAADATATTTWAVGGGAQAAAVIANATDTSLTSGGWPRLDSVSTNNSLDASVVQGYATGDLAKLRRPARGVTVEVDAAWWWGSGGRPGDKARLVADHAVIGRIDFTSRIIDVAWDMQSSWVALTLADTLAEDGF